VQSCVQLKQRGCWDDAFSDVQEANETDSTTQTDNKMQMVRKNTMVIDMSEDNLIRIMKTGAKMLRFTKTRITEVRVYLNEDEDELVCGVKRSKCLLSFIIKYQPTYNFCPKLL